MYSQSQRVKVHLELQVLLGVTSLLSSCADGRLDHIESVCQRILSLDEILEILTATDISLDRKLPFLRFLTSVYVDTVSSLSDDANDFNELLNGE